jgi:hypothetical protein
MLSNLHKKTYRSLHSNLGFFSFLRFFSLIIIERTKKKYKNIKKDILYRVTFQSSINNKKKSEERTEKYARASE